jgi:hypothetical protein
MQADPEHQEHHADVGKLARERDVGDESGREGADEYPGEQVADHRRHSETGRDKAKHHRQAKADHDSGDEIYVMRHDRMISNPRLGCRQTVQLSAARVGGLTVAQLIEEAMLSCSSSGNPIGDQPGLALDGNVAAPRDLKCLFVTA